ncbi:MAG: HEAT repeat domain-containing protein [Vicinamibacterales bacterium]
MDHTCRQNQPSQWIFAAIGALVMVCALQASAFGQSAVVVSWAGDRLSVTAANVPLADVLREIALRTGSKIVGLEQATERVSIDVHDATLSYVLHLLLSDVDVNYVYRARPATRTGVAMWLAGATAPRASACPAGGCGGPAVIAVDGAAAPLTTSWTTDPGPVDNVARLTADGAFGAGATQASLIGLTKDPDFNVRIMAIQTLALQMTPEGVAAIREALNDEHPFVRGEAIALMGELGSSPGTTALVGELLEHPNHEVRETAAIVLGERDGEEARYLLERALGDEDGAVRGLAAQSLRQKQLSERPKR